MRLWLLTFVLALAGASFGQSPIPITGTGHVECTFGGTNSRSLTISGSSADETVSFSGSASYPGTAPGSWNNLCTKAQIPIVKEVYVPGSPSENESFPGLSCGGAPMYCREGLMLPGQLLTGTASIGGQTASQFRLGLSGNTGYLTFTHEGAPVTARPFGYIKITSQSRIVQGDGTVLYELDFIILPTWEAGAY